MLWIYRSSAMLKVNFKDIVTVNSLVRLIIKVVRYEDIALLFIVCNFISRSSYKSNCLTKFTASIFTIQFSLSRIINVGNLGCLRISTVMYGYINIRIAKVNGFTFCSLNIRCVTSKHWTRNVIQCLTVSGCPSNFAGYFVLNTSSSKVDCLLAIAWCL